jgi:hypothetical protein
MMAVLDLEVKNEKMNKITILLSILLLFTIACNKKRTLHIKAINAVTGEPYAGLAYGISATTTGIGGEKKVYDHKGTLDANGEAFVTLRVRGNRTYNVGCTKPPNTCYVKDINFSFGKEDKTKNDFQFEYAECATMQRKVKNVNCFDANDKIEITIQNTVNSLLPNPWVLNGCSEYETVPTLVPIGTYNLKWVVTKNGVSTTYNDSFVLNENDFKYHTINY